MRTLLDEGVVVRGDKLRLDTLVSEKHGVDTLAGMLQGVQKKGLSGQKQKKPGKRGLVHLIDEWLEDKEDKSVEFVRASCDQILDYARVSYC